MKEMKNVFAGVGLMVITGKSFYYLSLVTNSLFFFTFLFCLVIYSDDSEKVIACEESVRDQTKSLGIWAMVTSIVAITSLICFTQFQKGQTISVVGQLSYVANLISMLVLFVIAQTVVFSNSGVECEKASDLSSFRLTFHALFIWVCVQYFKLLILLVGLISTACCVKSGINNIKGSDQFSSIAQPNFGKPNSGFAPKLLRKEKLGLSDPTSRPHPMAKLL